MKTQFLIPIEFLWNFCALREHNTTSTKSAANRVAARNKSNSISVQRKVCFRFVYVGICVSN